MDKNWRPPEGWKLPVSYNIVDFPTQNSVFEAGASAIIPFVEAEVRQATLKETAKWSGGRCAHTAQDEPWRYRFQCQQCCADLLDSCSSGKMPEVDLRILYDRLLDRVNHLEEEARGHVRFERLLGRVNHLEEEHHPGMRL